MKLSRTEEQLMEILWKQKEAFLKDLLAGFPEPQPASTTIATLLKRMADKKFVGYKVFGNSRQYFPLVKKSDYFALHVRELIRDFFGNSSMQFASFFTTSSNLSAAELKELKKLIEVEIQKKKR